MVIQRNWKTSNSDVLLQNSSSEDSSGSWQLPPSNRSGLTQNPQSSANMPNRNVINRQVALNTLAAMHRRFSLPGIIQTNGRPPAEFRASANKSLDILRQNIQAAVTKEIDQVIKKYLEKFFVPAVNNIRSNLGEESVSEEQVRAVCRAMLDGARCLYAAPPRHLPLATSRPTASPSELSDSESSNGADSRFGRPSSSPSYGKRKESDTDSDAGVGLGSGRRKRRTEGVVCPAHKWDPARLTADTLFIMGSIANKVLGLGQSRGRLYSKHAGLLRYPADSADKEWIANQNLTTPAGGRTYIMVLEDIEELVVSDDYRHSPALQLNELSGFRAPPFMLRKIQSFLSRRGEMSEEYNSSTPTPTPPPAESLQIASTSKSSYIKIEDADDSSELPVHLKPEDVDDLSKDTHKIIKAEDINDHNMQRSGMNNQNVKIEQNDDSIKFEPNSNNNIPQHSGNFTSIISSGIPTIDNSYWKCLTGSQTMTNDASGSSSINNMKVELGSAAEFIDADIEFLSSDFCSYVDSEADVKKSFDRLSDGGEVSYQNLLTTTAQTPVISTHQINYSQPNSDVSMAKPTIVTSIVGSVAIGSMASNVVQTYVAAGSQNTIKSIGNTSRMPCSSAVFSTPSLPVTYTQTLSGFSQTSLSPHGQAVSQVPQCSNSNVTINLQPTGIQPTTRTVYSLANNSKTLNSAMSPGSTIIGFGGRPSVTGNIINTGNFINISAKNFSSGNILHNAIVSRNMVNRGLNINRCDLTKSAACNLNLASAKSSTVIPSVASSTYSRISAVTLPSKIDLNDDASITTTKAMIDNTCNSSAMLKKVLTLGSAGVNKTFLSPPTQKLSSVRTTASTSSALSASHATLSALLSSGPDSSHSDKKNSFVIPQNDK